MVNTAPEQDFGAAHLSEELPDLPLSPHQQHFLQKLYLHRPRVTYLIIATNFLLFLLMELSRGSRNLQTLIEFGARYNPLIKQGQYWRLISSTFLHAGYLHILLNMYGLFNIGRVIESLYGSTRFLFLYLLAGLAGSMTSWLVSDHLSVGASGALFGVAGVMIVYGYKHKHTIPREMASNFGRGAIPIVALNLYLGFYHPQIDNYAHLGGLLAGIAISAVMNPDEIGNVGEQGRSVPKFLMQSVSAALLLYGFFAGVKNYQPQRLLHRAERHFLQGSQLSQQGKSREAVTEFKEAIAIDKHQPRFHLGLGSAYLNLGKGKEAIQEYEEAIRLKPDAGEAYFNLAMALKREGNREKAIPAYQKAIELTPELVPAYLDLGMYYLQSSEDENAAKVFKALLHTRRTAESYLVVGQAYLASGRKQMAIDHLRQAVILKPDLAEGYYLLGTALQRSQNRAEALQNYQRALQLNKNLQPAKIALGRLHRQQSIEYLKNKQWDEAESEINRLREVDNSNTEVHLLLGTVYLNKQQFAQARQEFEIYLKLVPNSPNAATLRNQIDRLPNPPTSSRKE